MNLHILRSPESENHSFRVWSACMCVCVSMCVSVSVISITKKKITSETSNLVFYICIMYKYYLKLFIKIR